MPEWQQEFLNTLYAWGPKVLAAGAIVIGGWILAGLLRSGLSAGIDGTRIGKSANESRQPGEPTLGHAIGDAIGAIVKLVAVIFALIALGLDSLVQPLQNMLNDFLGVLPQLIGAGLLFFVGLIVATLARRALTTTLTATGVDALAERYGFGGGTGGAGVSKAIATVVFALILLPITIMALDILAIETITRPAQAMLESILVTLPRIVIAVIVLGLAWVIGRFAAGLIETALPGLGFDQSVSRLGLLGEGADRGLTPSKIAANLALFFIVLSGALMATRLLDFPVLNAMIAEVLTLGARVIFGGVIIAAGVVIARLVSNAIAATGSGMTDTAASFVRVAVIVLAVAIGLSHMGVADQIVNAAFMITLAAIGVAAALAFGFGGQDAARRLLAKWVKEED